MQEQTHEFGARYSIGDRTDDYPLAEYSMEEGEGADSVYGGQNQQQHPPLSFDESSVSVVDLKAEVMADKIYEMEQSLYFGRTHPKKPSTFLYCLVSWVQALTAIMFCLQLLMVAFAVPFFTHADKKGQDFTLAFMTPTIMIWCLQLGFLGYIMRQILKTGVYRAARYTDLWVKGIAFHICWDVSSIVLISVGMWSKYAVLCLLPLALYGGIVCMVHFKNTFRHNAPTRGMHKYRALYASDLPFPSMFLQGFWGAPLSNSSGLNNADPSSTMFGIDDVDDPPPPPPPEVRAVAGDSRPTAGSKPAHAPPGYRQVPPSNDDNLSSKPASPPPAAAAVVSPKTPPRFGSSSNTGLF